MSYKDQEIVLDRQQLIGLAEKSDFGVRVKHYNGAILIRKLRNENKCIFTFNKSVAWDDGVTLKKLKAPHIAELTIDKDFKIPDQSPFQHCKIRLEPEIRF